MAGKRKRSKKVKKTKEQLEVIRKEKKFKTDIRTIFTNAGFEYVATREQQFTFNNATTDFDGICICKNLIVILEDTTLAEPDDHLRKKDDAWQLLVEDTGKFVEQLGIKFPGVKEVFENQSKYSCDDYKVRFVYISLNDIGEDVKTRYKKRIRFMENARLQYFLSLSKTIKRSALFELLSFLDIKLEDFEFTGTNRKVIDYKGLYLPESPSGFPTGHKIVSLLMDPQTLLERCYVLRKDGWRDEDALYQRLLVKGKIEDMRAYLNSEKRVFVNNIIVTLPDDVQIWDSKEEHRISLDDSKRRTGTEPIVIKLPTRLGSIGIIDGQHRIFAYHEGYPTDKHEKVIADFRTKQHLLVTGIIYPSSYTDHKKQGFEAKLFLEINDKQKRVRGDLKQDIETIVRPNTAIAIAKSVISRLALNGPLSGYIQSHVFDTKKLKTTSIVSYGLKYVVDPERDDLLFKRWPSSEKEKFGHSKESINDYVNYCVSSLSPFFGAFRAHLGKDMWTLDKEKSRALNATSINGLIYAFRMIVAKNKPLKFEDYQARFKKLAIRYEPRHFKYKSSHWKSLGEDIVKQCFSDIC